jgi:radical SAM protein with 4Fe4S-binding SPASM domain
MSPKFTSTEFGRVKLQDYVPMSYPFAVNVEPSRYCNLRCEFCPQGRLNGEVEKGFMSLEVFKKMIDDIGQFPQKPHILRICGCGDGLLNKDILPMLQYAKDKKAVKFIDHITNGIGINKEIISELPHLVDRIVISLNGLSRKEYKDNCGVDVDFSKLLDNLRGLYACRGNCIIHIKTDKKIVSTPMRMELFNYLFGRRCDEYFFENITPIWPEFNYVPHKDESRFAGPVVKHLVCPQTFKSPQVMCNGIVSPCCADWKRINAIGDITKESFVDIWNGERLRNLQIAHLQGKRPEMRFCKDCYLNEYCDTDNLDSSREEILKRMNKEN